MSRKKKLLLILMTLFVVVLNFSVLFHQSPRGGLVDLKIAMQADVTETLQVYYSPLEDFQEERSNTANYKDKYENGTMGEMDELTFPVDTSTGYLRIDLGTQPGNYRIYSMTVNYKNTSCEIPLETAVNAEKYNQIEQMELNQDENGEQVLCISVNGSDPYLILPVDLETVRNAFSKSAEISDIWKKVLTLLILDGSFLFVLKYRKKAVALPVELIQNRHLIFSLAKNDFKTKYAGSYLGIVWAFVQPIVTVLVYWFVFQVGLRSSSVGDTPFVLWMVAGLVPWFFFSDTLNSGTNSLIEYSYLVKKVVFKISILPMVKEISALFVHLFFILFTIILFACYGYFPDLYTLQVLYYTFCIFVLALGICYATSAIVIFFRDLSQIIGIILQVGVWATPIMWNIDTIDLPRQLQWIFKINPMYYIVTGYRDSLINKVWFFEHFDMTVYFWMITAALFAVGTVIFKRLKVHFADVL